MAVKSCILTQMCIRDSCSSDNVLFFLITSNVPNLKKKGPKRVSFLVLYADLGVTGILSNHSPKAFTFPENNPLSSILPSTICSSWSKFEISKFLTSSMINRCRLPSVSYTHLDVYKRQRGSRLFERSIKSRPSWLARIR